MLGTDREEDPSKSLSVRLPLLFVASVIVIILVVIPLVFLHFHNRTIDQYTRMAQGVTQLMVNAVDGDKVDEYIEMDESFVPKLFESFSQEDATATNRYGGSGLGMAITKNMVDLMGGTIAVESEKGRGTTFTVEVPLKRAHHVEVPDAQVQPGQDVSVAGLHVLIAEDMEMNAEILADLLELEDITSEWAENGQRALEVFADSDEGHFAAILMDMRMPVMDGLSATREIRKLDRPDAAPIPSIALTANAFEEDVQQCLSAGMNAHLLKPVEIELLKKTLSKLLVSQG